MSDKKSTLPPVDLNKSTDTQFLISELRRIGEEFGETPVIQAVMLESAKRLEMYWDVWAMKEAE